MPKTQTDEQGRRYVDRPDGTRVYLPTVPLSRKARKQYQDQIAAYHHAMKKQEDE